MGYHSVTLSRVVREYQHQVETIVDKFMARVAVPIDRVDSVTVLDGKVSSIRLHEIEYGRNGYLYITLSREDADEWGVNCSVPDWMSPDELDSVIQELKLCSEWLESLNAYHE